MGRIVGLGGGVGRDLRAVVGAAGRRESQLRACSDAELREFVGVLRGRFVVGDLSESGGVLAEACAVVREAGRRAVGLRLSDDQVAAGVAVRAGRLVVMPGGAGKTVAVLVPAFLAALTGAAVHVATLNGYLARRDAEWLGPVYRLLGMDCGVIGSESDAGQRRAAYRAEVTYGPHTEFGYDYLRDNLAWDLAEIVQRGRAVAIVDDADCILLANSRAPMLIAGAGKTLATITAGQYFRLYDRIGGLASAATRQGTRLAVASRLEVTAIPRRPRRTRTGGHAVIYNATAAKLREVVEEALRQHRTGRPVLIAVASAQTGEQVCDQLTERGVRHWAVTGDDDDRDAGHIAQAGRLGAVTVVTAEAGRGVDLPLGGRPDEPPGQPVGAPTGSGNVTGPPATERDGVLARGGLCVLAAELPTSEMAWRRVGDWAGRRGDPGHYRAYLSLEDPLAGQATRMMMRLVRARAHPADRPFTRWRRGLLDAGLATDWHYFDQYRTTLDLLLIQYEQVLDDHRRNVYARRHALLQAQDLREHLYRAFAEAADAHITAALAGGGDLDALHAALAELYPTSLTVAELSGPAGGDLATTTTTGNADAIGETIRADFDAAYRRRQAQLGLAAPQHQNLLLRTALAPLDRAWTAHLEQQDELLDGKFASLPERRVTAGLNNVGAELPEYQRRGTQLLARTLRTATDDWIKFVFTVKIDKPDTLAEPS